MARLQVTIVGGGMITRDQLLPSLYHLQRAGEIGDLRVCALLSTPLKALAEAPEFAEAFPGQGFAPSPPLTDDPKNTYPQIHSEVIGKMAPDNLVVVAVPDNAHYAVTSEALRRGQNVLSVKPLVLSYAQAVEIEHRARERGLYVGVEYHKRFDRRCLEARQRYRAGQFGEFKCGEAKLVECYYYRHSNFQNWFVKENTDPFTYIGCHYVDLAYFITGLRPTEVSLQGVEGKFPNGNAGYLWSSGRVRFENGALLSILNGLGAPDEGMTNDQAMCLYGEGANGGTIIKHDDQHRGVQHGYAMDGVGRSRYRIVSPDYFRLVPWGGPGLRPVGYGYDSVEAHVQALQRVRAAGDLVARRKVLDEIDLAGILPTPQNSSVNELVVEAARLSIAHDGRAAAIDYGPSPRVRLR